MTAELVKVGRPAHDAELQGIAYLVRGLPSDFTVYTNSWLAERSGAIYELDAVVVAPHAIFVVEIKSFRGRVEGTDHDWLLPEPIRSPLKTNRLTAQKLHSELQRRSRAAGRPWVEGYVFLSHTEDVALQGEASRHRVHTKSSILPALRDPDYLPNHLTRFRPDPVDDHARAEVHRLLTGVDKSHAPSRRVREYELLGVQVRSDEFVEYRTRHTMTGQPHALRVYTVPWTATDAQRQRIQERAAWESRVLVNVGHHPYVVTAEAPFVDEIGICLPLEQFPGITLDSWVERYLDEAEVWPALKSRLHMWEKVARALHFAHLQGVVHRQLRPEVILVEDQPDDPHVRLTGFDLAKQLEAGSTVAWTSLDDERLIWAAPEVVRDFHAAEPRSDQFSLGALLGLLSTGRPPFPNTKSFVQRGSRPPSLHEMESRLPRGIDTVAARLLADSPVDRYETVRDALTALVEVLRQKRATTARPIEPDIDPEDMPPGTRLGVDYEVLSCIGSGGMATVYLARHLASGNQRAIKVARPNDRAEAALRDEYEILRALDHHAVVDVVDLSNVVPDRVSLIMEKVDGLPLGEWLDEHPTPDLSIMHRYGADLLDGLGYLESCGITHKDLKPDNLILGDRGLTLIDFSLVNSPEEQIFVGTALYRDPALETWDAAADRYAAVLCLFELYVGSHAFDGYAPEPETEVRIDEDEVEPPALAAFFRRALSPDRSERYASLGALRDAFSKAVGRPVARVDTAARYDDLIDDPRLPLPDGALSTGTMSALRRAGIALQGHLVAASPDQLRRVRHIGRKRLHAVLELRDALTARGVEPLPTTREPIEPPLVAGLVGDSRPAEALRVSRGLTDSLVKHGYATVGDVAAATADDLLAIPYVGTAKLAMIRRALDSILRDTELVETRAEELSTLEAAWAAATAKLDPQERSALEIRFGSEGRPMDEAEVAERLELSPQTVRLRLNSARDKLEGDHLLPALRALRQECEAADGVLSMEEAISAVVGTLPSEDDLLASVAARVAAWWHDDEPQWLEEVPELDDELFTLRRIDAEAIGGFVAEARQLAAWPPTPAEAARKSLEMALGFNADDPLALAVRIVPGVRLTPGGQLFLPPVDPANAIRHAVRTERLPLGLEELKAELDRRFAGEVAWPPDKDLAEIVQSMDLPHVDIEDGMLVERPAAAPTVPPLEPDDLPEFLRVPAKTPEEIAGEWLRGTERAAHWRLVVTPPEQHPELSRNVARAIGPEATFVSFETEFLQRIEVKGFDQFERAERFSAMRGTLKREAESLLEDLVAQFGSQGEIVVLGDTAILELCEATHLVKKIYDITLGGRRGSWVVVIPGVIHNRQPMLNESEPLFAMDGAVLPLRAEIPL